MVRDRTRTDNIGDILPKHGPRTVPKVVASPCSPAPGLASAALVRWPHQAGWRSERAARGLPTLLVIDRGVPVPPLGAAEDWAWSDADERDVAHRLQGLGLHERGRSDVPDVELPADLPAEGHRLAARLLASIGSLVPRAELPGDDLDEVTVTLQAFLGPQGWSLLTVAGAGLLLVREGRCEP